MFFLDDYFLVVIVTVCSQKFHVAFVHHHSLIHHEKHKAAMPKQASYRCCKLPGCLTRGSFLLLCIESVRRCGPGSKIKPVYQVLSSLQRLSDRNFAVFSFHPQRKKTSFAFGACSANIARPNICHTQMMLTSRKGEY